MHTTDHKFKYNLHTFFNIRLNLTTLEYVRLTQKFCLGDIAKKYWLEHLIYS